MRILFLVAYCFGSTVFAAPFYDGLPDMMETMKSCRIVQSFPIQSATLRRGPVTLEFISGMVEVTDPVGDRYHTAVFIGEGVVRYDPSHPIEKEQLRKFTKAEQLNERLKGIVLKFSDATAEELMKSAGTTPGVGAAERSSSVCKETRKKILEKYYANVDSRILRDIHSRKTGYFLAYVSGRSLGEFIIEIDPEGSEPFTIAQHVDLRDEVIDVWSAMEIPEIQAQGAIGIPHFQIDLTLEKDGKFASTNTLTIVAMQQPLLTVPLSLSSYMETIEVTDATGRPLFFVQELARDRFGQPPRRQTTLDVFLPEPISPGKEHSLKIQLKSEDLIEQVRGKKEYFLKNTIGWYPTAGYLQRSTSTVTYRFPQNLQLVAVGTKMKEWVEGEQQCATYEQKIPVAYICFAIGEFKQMQISEEDLPLVSVYSGKFHSGIRLHGDAHDNVTRDIANSLRFFEEHLTDYPFPSITAMEIPENHGQGFPGFLRLSRVTFDDDRLSGVDASFRAHEVAHQWWGQLVGWQSYHDQWLSEGFAEFWGALFSDGAHEGKNLMEMIVQSWKTDILHGGSLGRSRFGARKLTSKQTKGSKSGPLWLGSRLYSSKSTADYKILVYEKGAYVLHMLRSMMKDYENNNDDRFFAMMKDFVTRHRWKEPSTVDFQEVVSEHMGQDMQWFFDQWVYGTDIPKYLFEWNLGKGKDGGWELVCRIQQKDVPVGFRMPVPLQIDFGSNGEKVVILQIDEPAETFRIPVAEPPQKVRFNYNDAVLAY